MKQDARAEVTHKPVGRPEEALQKGIQVPLANLALDDDVKPQVWAMRQASKKNAHTPLENANLRSERELCHSNAYIGHFGPGSS